MMKKIYLALAVLALAVFFTGAYKKIGSLNGIFSKNTDIGMEAAKAKATDFVKNNLVEPGTEVSVKSITDEKGLYKLSITVGKQEVPAYITKDGSVFFPQAMVIADVEKQAASASSKDAEAQKDVPKTDKPAVDLYVMAFCPFGNKAEDTLAPVYALLKNKVDFNFHYIVSSKGDTIESLHGEKEVVEDEREACVLKNYGKDAWMDFATYVNKNCGSDGSCWEAGAKSLNIDASKITACVESSGSVIMKENETASTNAGASGSPTMIINGVTTKAVYQYGNSESYKQAICSAFSTAPEECSKALSSSTSTTQGGSCGN